MYGSLSPLCSIIQDSLNTQRYTNGKFRNMIMGPNFTLVLRLGRDRIEVMLGDKDISVIRGFQRR